MAAHINNLQYPQLCCIYPASLTTPRKKKTQHKACGEGRPEITGSGVTCGAQGRRYTL